MTFSFLCVFLILLNLKMIPLWRSSSSHKSNFYLSNHIDWSRSKNFKWKFDFRDNSVSLTLTMIEIHRPDCNNWRMDAWGVRVRAKEMRLKIHDHAGFALTEWNEMAFPIVEMHGLGLSFERCKLSRSLGGIWLFCGSNWNIFIWRYVRWRVVERLIRNGDLEICSDIMHQNQ
jgi:hypothetical protein